MIHYSNHGSTTTFRPRNTNTNKTIQLIVIVLVFILMIGIDMISSSSLVIGGVVEGRRTFTSDNGYDAGGEEPVCWEAIVDTTAVHAMIMEQQQQEQEETTTGEEVDIEEVLDLTELNELLFNETVVSDFQVLSKCYMGTSFSILGRGSQELPSSKSSNSNSNSNAASATEGGGEGSWESSLWYTGIPSTFRLELSTDVQFILSGIGGGGKNNTTNTTTNNTTYLVSQRPQPPSRPKNQDHQQEPLEIWMRLILCKATEVGFCSPFFDAADMNLMDEAVHHTQNEHNDHSIYNEKDIVYGIKRGTSHVYSPWITYLLQPSNETIQYNVTTTTPNPKPLKGIPLLGSVNIQFQLEQGMEGIYFMLGHAVLFFENGGPKAIRVDIADAIDKNIIEVREPPTILRIEFTFKLIMLIVIGIFTIGSIIMLVIIIYHRSNKLMTLAQGDLLGLLVLNSCIAIGSSWLFFPINDWFCRLSGPLCLIPNTFIASILVGRLWRVYMTLSVANSMGGGKSSTTTTSTTSSWNKNNNNLRTSMRTSMSNINVGQPNHTCCSRFTISEQDFMTGLGILAMAKCFPPKKNGKSGGGPPRYSGSGFRRTTTLGDTLRLIFMLTLPQIIIQVVGGIVYPARADIELVTEGGKLGREYCFRDRGRWTYMAGLIWLGVVYVLAVLVAWVSRNMPSAFNEKDQIFQAAGVNSIVSVIVISLIFITDLPETSPQITAFLWIAMVLSLSTISNWLIVLPKIRRLFSGEKVVISNMLRRVNHMSSSSTAPSSALGESVNSPTLPNTMIHKHGPSATTTTTTTPTTLPTSSSMSSGTKNNGENEANHTTAQQKPPVNVSEEYKARRRKPKIVLKEEDPIPKSIEQEMYAMQDLIQRVNNASLHGRPVDIRDWRLLKVLSAQLSAEVNRVECDWSAHFASSDKKFDEENDMYEGESSAPDTADAM